MCIGSIAELEELTGKKVEDLHRENIDHIEIPSPSSGECEFNILFRIPV